MELKILHITNDYFHTEVYKRLHHALMKADVSSMVFTPIAYTGEVLYDERVECLRCFSKYDRIYFKGKQNKIYAKLCPIVQREKPTLIHAHFIFSAGYLAYRIKQVFNIPYIVAVRNSDINVFFRYCFWLRKIGVEILKNAEKIVFLSKSYEKVLFKKYIPLDLRHCIERKAVCIPNGISQSWLENRNVPKASPHKPLRIVFAGKIDKNKNVATIAKACRVLESEGVEAILTVVGDVGNKLVYRILKQRFPGIVFIPKQKPEALRDIFRKNDVFIMPSFFESFGLVYAEAMSQGLPVIYTENQGFDKQFEEGIVGYHVDPRKPTEIAERIKDIIDEYEKISKNCVSFSVSFDWGKVTERYMELYENALSSTSERITG